MDQQNKGIFNYNMMVPQNTPCAPFEHKGLFCRSLHTKNVGFESGLIQGEQSQPIKRPKTPAMKKKNVPKMTSDSYFSPVGELRDSKSLMSEIPYNRILPIYPEIPVMSVLPSVNTRNEMKDSKK